MLRQSQIVDNDVFYIRLLWYGAQVIDRTWNAQNISSSYWRLYVNSRDCASLLLPGGGRYRLAAGRIHLIPAWVRFSCHNMHALDHFFVHFDPISIPGAVVRQIFPQPIAVTADAELEGMIDRVRDLIAIAPPLTPALICDIKSVVYRALAVFFSGLPTAVLTRVHALAGNDSHVSDAVIYIEAHLNVALTNMRLAQCCGLSEDHFIRRFREHMGQTPAQYIMERRVAMAAQRLVYSADSIESLATQCGFPDRYYFTRVFTRRMGQSPARYRLQGRV